ncbi:MAG: protein required for attachment to host cells [Paraglaciecola sp.]|jgi:protein required for attachment to host cells
MSNNKWLLIANGANAIILSYHNIFQSLEVLPNGKLQHVNLPSGELVTTDRGRGINSASGGRSAFERPTDPHTHEKQVFASEITDFLQQHQDKFISLIVVAAPKTLGDLRHAFSKQMKDKVIAEVSKDFTHIKIHELPTKLRALLLDTLWPGAANG